MTTVRARHDLCIDVELSYVSKQYTVSRLFSAICQSDSVVSLDDQSLPIKRLCLTPPILPFLEEQIVVVYTGKDSFFCIKLFLECLQQGHLFFPAFNVDAQIIHQLQNYLPVLVVYNSNQMNLHKRISFGIEHEKEFPREGGLVVQTSGTTSGTKKYALISERMILENIENFHSKVEAGNSTAICFTSFEHTSGFNALLMPSLMKNAHVKLIQNFPAFKVSVHVANTDQPLLHLTPMQFSILTQTNFLNTLIEKRGTLVVGSTEVRSKTLRLLKNKSFKSYVNYGLTEAGPYILTTPIKTDVNTVGFDIEKDSPKGTKKKMVPFNKDKTLFKLSLSGEGLFNGYLNSYKFNRDIDWFETGDVFEKKDEKYFFFSRDCDLIYENDNYYSASLIEDDILENFPVAEDCLIRKLSSGYTIYLQTALIVGKDSVVDYLKQKHFYLGNKIEICYVKKIPRTLSGKMVRK